MTKLQSDIIEAYKSGKTIKEISMVCGCQINTIKNALAKRELFFIKHSNNKTVQKSCLRCNKKFASEGKHNRMCNSCASVDDDLAMFNGHKVVVHVSKAANDDH